VKDDLDLRKFAPELVRAFGDIERSKLVEALDWSVPDLIALPLATRNAVVQIALLTRAGTAILATQLGAMGVRADGAPVGGVSSEDVRRFRLHYQGTDVERGRAVHGKKDLDALVRDVGTFKTRAPELIAKLGDHRLSTILSAASELTEGRIATVSQLGRLPAATRIPLLEKIIERVLRAPELPVVSPTPTPPRHESRLGRWIGRIASRTSEIARRLVRWDQRQPSSSTRSNATRQIAPSSS
jgi:hypothetical protein